VLSLMRSDSSKWGFRCEHICQDFRRDFVLLVFFFVQVDCEVMGLITMVFRFEKIYESLAGYTPVAGFSRCIGSASRP
jgi:hypothetical protein